MRREAALALALTVMLCVLTPIGTGSGAHRDQLLHPIFPHRHAERVPKTALDPLIPTPGSGPVLGAGAGAAEVAGGAGLTPPLPRIEGALPPSWFERELLPNYPSMPLGWSDQPPDPPPTSVAR